MNLIYVKLRLYLDFALLMYHTFSFTKNLGVLWDSKLCFHHNINGVSFPTKCLLIPPLRGILQRPGAVRVENICICCLDTPTHEYSYQLDSTGRHFVVYFIGSMCFSDICESRYEVSRSHISCVNLSSLQF